MKVEGAKLEKIKHIHIFGMQCSGTNHLMKTLQLNIPKASGVTVDHNVLGWKHDDIWSQSGFANEKNSKVLFDERPSPEVIYNSLIIVIYRNPISWAQSLHLLPHQAPKLFGLSFSDFIRSPFETFYTPVGKDIPKDEAELSGITRADRVWDRYPDIFTMRSVKVSLFESFKYRVPNVCYVNLETLNEHPIELLDYISKHYGIPLKKRFTINITDKHGDVAYVPKQYAVVNKVDFSYLIKNIAVEKEQQIGYRLRTAYRPIKFGKLDGPLMIPVHVPSAFAVSYAIRMFSYSRGDRTETISLVPSGD